MRYTTSASKKKSIRQASKAGNSPAFGFKLNPVAKGIIGGMVAALFWFIIWYALAAHIDKEVILPLPTVVLSRLTDLIAEKEFWISCGTTILRIIWGTVLGCAGGIVLAILMLVSNIVRTLFSPLLSAVKATPVASFIIAALFLMSRVEVPSFISFLIVLPIICDAVYTGIRNADKGLLELATVYKFSLFKKFRTVLIPSAVPYFLSAIRTSIGMAWKSGVAAEVLCTPQDSIGRELYQTKVYMETADMFAWTLTIILLSIIFEKLTVWFVKRGLKKYGASKEDNHAED